jgi:glutathione S-transferase
MRLHDYPSSANCYKVRLLAAQLDLDYERVNVDIFGGDTLTDDFARLNPARMTPVLETEDGPLPESNAILVHLAEGTELLPDQPGPRAQVLRWLFYEQAEVQPGIAGLRFRLLTGRLDPDHPSVRARQATGAAVLQVLDDHLREQPFLVGGRYSIADISLYAYVHVADEAAFDLGDYPAVREWVARVEATPRYMNDLQPMPPNSQLGVSRGIYG